VSGYCGVPGWLAACVAGPFAAVGDAFGDGVKRHSSGRTGWHHSLALNENLALATLNVDEIGGMGSTFAVGKLRYYFDNRSNAARAPVGERNSCSYDDGFCLCVLAQRPAGLKQSLQYTGLSPRGWNGTRAVWPQLAQGTSYIWRGPEERKPPPPPPPP